MLKRLTGAKRRSHSSTQLQRFLVLVRPHLNPKGARSAPEPPATGAAEVLDRRKRCLLMNSICTCLSDHNFEKGFIIFCAISCIQPNMKSFVEKNCHYPGENFGNFGKCRPVFPIGCGIVWWTDWLFSWLCNEIIVCEITGSPDFNTLSKSRQILTNQKPLVEPFITRISKFFCTSAFWQTSWPWNSIVFVWWTLWSKNVICLLAKVIFSAITMIKFHQKLGRAN